MPNRNIAVFMLVMVAYLLMERTQCAAHVSPLVFVRPCGCGFACSGIPVQTASSCPADRVCKGGGRNFGCYTKQVRTRLEGFRVPDRRWQVFCEPGP